MDRPKRRKGILIHRVQCADCNEEGYAEIDKKTGKILNEDYWFYFGKMNLRPSKYVYKWLGNGKFSERELNPSYDPKLKPFYIEFWEHSKHSDEEPTK